MPRKKNTAGKRAGSSHQCKEIFQSKSHIKEEAVQAHTATVNDTKTKQQKKFEELRNKVSETNKNENDYGWEEKV